MPSSTTAMTCCSRGECKACDLALLGPWGQGCLSKGWVQDAPQGRGAAPCESTCMACVGICLGLVWYHV